MKFISALVAALTLSCVTGFIGYKINSSQKEVVSQPQTFVTDFKLNLKIGNEEKIFNLQNDSQQIEIEVPFCEDNCDKEWDGWTTPLLLNMGWECRATRVSLGDSSSLIVSSILTCKSEGNDRLDKSTIIEGGEYIISINVQCDPKKIDSDAGEISIQSSRLDEEKTAYFSLSCETKLVNF